jgi:hypothetical protein
MEEKGQPVPRKNRRLRQLLQKGSFLGAQIAAAGAGGVAGAAGGLLIAGPPGILLGGVLGAVVQDAAVRLSAHLEKRQEARVGCLVLNIVAYSQAFIESGKSLRPDFTENKGSNRQKAAEILEGTFLKAREQFEELKIPHLAYFYSFIAFNEQILLQRASYLLNLFEKLTYEELCILRILSEKEKHHLRTEHGSNVHIDMVLWQEMYELFQNGLVDLKVNRIGPDAVVPGYLALTHYGENFAEYFGLSGIAESHLSEILAKLEI